MEWCPAGWSVCLPLLIVACTTKSRSSLLALAHRGGPGKKGRKTVVVVVPVHHILREACSMHYSVHQDQQQQAKQHWDKTVQVRHLTHSYTPRSSSALHSLGAFWFLTVIISHAGRHEQSHTPPEWPRCTTPVAAF